ncbi:MAG: hypothetical protein FWF96_05940, partial [Kiritimatiellaeota bacterium]|nr:hypothetical protein [Kiritimatiellota bacterium]
QLLYGVARGMPEVQRPPWPDVFFISADEAAFYANAGLDYLIHSGSKRFFQLEKQFRIGDDTVFYGFGGSVSEDFIRKRRQSIGIADHHAGLAERAHQVFARGEVHPRFSPNRRVHRGQKSRGRLYEIYSPQVNRGGESREVADDAATERDDNVRAGEAVGVEIFPKREKVVGVFGGFAGRQNFCGDCEPDVGKRTRDTFEIKWRDVFIRDDARAAPSDDACGFGADLVEGVGLDDEFHGFFRLHSMAGVCHRGRST